MQTQLAGANDLPAIGNVVPAANATPATGGPMPKPASSDQIGLPGIWFILTLALIVVIFLSRRPA